MLLKGKGTRVQKLNIGDKVIIDNASAASLNLYMKAKQAGYNFIKCPCNAKAGQVFDVIDNFYNGYLLRDIKLNICVVAFGSDVRRVQV